MAWELRGDRPIYLQLMENIQIRILSGEYSPGSRLSSVRDLAGEAAVNPNTMQKALSELERLSLIYAQRTSGRFITEDTQMIDQLKETLAREKIGQFFENMKAIGYDKAETLLLLQDTVGPKEENEE